MRKLGRGEVVRQGTMDTLGQAETDKPRRATLADVQAALDRMMGEHPPYEAMRDVRTKTRRWLGLKMEAIK